MSNAKKVGKMIEAKLKKAINRKTMFSIGEQASAIVEKRTRLGYGSDKPGASRQRLKPLSERYKERRAKDKRLGILAPSTSPNKSNLTRTDQMLKSIDVIQAKDGSVSYGPTGKRTDGKTNEEVAKYAEEGGRPFLAPTDRELTQLENFIRRLLIKFLRDF